MSKETADETVTVRLPKGTADKLRAATGVKFSTLVRTMCMNLLQKYSAEGREPVLDQMRADVADVIKEQTDGQAQS